MTRHVALLRAVNVGAHGKVAMADLRVLLADLGLGDPRTLLQSGNAVFDAGRARPAAIERQVEEALAERFGLKTDVMVRSAGECTPEVQTT